MDIAYDHIQEEALSPNGMEQKGEASTPMDLNTEVREAYTAISATPWGAKLGGFFSQVKKQSESYYEGARQELNAASTGASKGLTDLVNQTKNLSLLPKDGTTTAADGNGERSEKSVLSLPAGIGKEASSLLQQFGLMKNTTPDASVDAAKSGTVNDTDSFLRRFQSEAAMRLKKVHAAEDAADEALERFGMNIKSFLRDAITIAPPTLNADGTQKSAVLFESKDAEGRRVVHATRFDAQLHVIHTTATSFIQDPQSEEYGRWKESFNVESKTGDIARDLEKYEELRRAMEKVVPEKVDCGNFWTRYYFLRHVIETEEQRRRVLLQKTQDEDEEVRWDDDEEEVEEVKEEEAKKDEVKEDEDEQENDDHHKEEEAPTSAGTETIAVTEPEAIDDGSKTPTKATTPDESSGSDTFLKPAEPRRSNEHSVADSDASYDILSGATSRGPGTPGVGEERDSSGSKPSKGAEEEEDDDWE